LTKAFVHKVCRIEYYDAITSGIFTDEFCAQGPREWAKQALKSSEEAMESYMVEVIA